MSHKPNASFSGQQYIEEVLLQCGNNGIFLNGGSKALAVPYRKIDIPVRRSRAGRAETGQKI